ncbi:MAG TPA: insulinase family protein, partial [Pseudomonadales bacterium]|nr:insulinase family protein [Pseudomonadales bacterium]
RIHHELSGLAGIERMKALDDALESADAMEEMLDALCVLNDRVVAADRQLLLVCEDSFMPEAVDVLATQWSQATGGSNGSDGVDLDGFEVPPLDQAWVTTTQVNFCAMAIPTVPEDHPDAAALTVLGGVLRNGYLHKVLREQGGAYGGGASHDSSNGIFRFHSYRDPNLLRTFEAFGESVNWVIKRDIGFDLVEESILGIMAGIDAPASPAGSARQAFHHALFGRTAEHRRRIRAHILEVGVDDIKRVAETYLTVPGSRAVLTSEAGAASLPDSFVITDI